MTDLERAIHEEREAYKRYMDHERKTKKAFDHWRECVDKVRNANNAAYFAPPAATPVDGVC